MKFKTIGDQNKPVIIWAHGWGQNSESFRALASSLEPCAYHILLDLSGFGESPPPPEHWGTADYADEIAALIKGQNQGQGQDKNELSAQIKGRKILWVGHSFGCRVGLQLAARHPELLGGLALIAGAGLPRKRSPYKKLEQMIRIYSFKGLKTLIPLGLVDKDKLMNKFGSADYRSAGPLRTIFVRVVNEDLTEQARQVTCPTLLIYGTKDTETPPEIGERLNKLISGSEMVHLEGQDHYSVLSGGRHQVAALLKRFLEKLDLT